MDVEGLPVNRWKSTTLEYYKENYQSAKCLTGVGLESSNRALEALQASNRSEKDLESSRALEALGTSNQALNTLEASNRAMLVC